MICNAHDEVQTLLLLFFPLLIASCLSHVFCPKLLCIQKMCMMSCVCCVSISKYKDKTGIWGSITLLTLYRSKLSTRCKDF